MPPKIGPVPAQARTEPRQAWPGRAVLELRQQAQQEAIDVARQAAQEVYADRVDVPLNERKAQALYASGFGFVGQPVAEPQPPEQDRLAEGSSSSLFISVAEGEQAAGQPAPATPPQVPARASCLRAAARTLMGSVSMAAGVGLTAGGYATDDSTAQAFGFVLVGAGAALLAGQFGRQLCQAAIRHFGCASEAAPAT